MLVILNHYIVATEEKQGHRPGKKENEKKLIFENSEKINNILLMFNPVLFMNHKG